MLSCSICRNCSCLFSFDHGCKHSSFTYIQGVKEKCFENSYFCSIFLEDCLDKIPFPSRCIIYLTFYLGISVTLLLKDSFWLCMLRTLSSLWKLLRDALPASIHGRRGWTKKSWDWTYQRVRSWFLVHGLMSWKTLAGFHALSVVRE